MITMGSLLLSRGCTSAFNQLGDGIAQLRAAALPIGYARHVEAQCFLVFRRDGIVKTHALDEATIAAVAGVRNDYVVKRAILRTAA
jgi:hypothetical protein